MRVYLLSLGAGLLVGIVYSLLNVRSPAPPVVALVGLFGILIGEQIIPVGALEALMAKPGYGRQAHAGWLAACRRLASVARHTAHLWPTARTPRAGNATQH